MKQKVEKQSATPLSSVLCVEGVNCKGYGLLAKYAMMDHDLPLESKTMYAYFCCQSGSGSCAFPSRDTILKDLHICKNTYYKYFPLLVEQGYIKVEHKKTEKHTFAVNVYTIVSNPKKFQREPEGGALPSTYSRIWFSGLKSAGYGMIPRAVMTDGRLPLLSKGIYAYFCSLTGAGKCAFPRVETIAFHLGVNISTYYKYMRYLTDLNYISVYQRHEGGSFHINDYCLNDMPDLNKATRKTIVVVPPQGVEKKDTGNQPAKLQDTEIPLPRKVQDTAPSKENALPMKTQDAGSQAKENWDTGAQDTTINSLTINSLTSNNLSIIEPEKGKKSGNRIGGEEKGRFVSPSMTRRQISKVLDRLLKGKPYGQQSPLLESVIDLATLQGSKPVCGIPVTADDFCDQLNQCISQGKFVHFFSQAIHALSEARKTRKIKNLRGYAASVAWNSLLSCQYEPSPVTDCSLERSYDLEAIERRIMAEIL